jgi:hypothetical protein
VQDGIDGLRKTRKGRKKRSDDEWCATVSRMQQTRFTRPCRE